MKTSTKKDNQLIEMSKSDLEARHQRQAGILGTSGHSIPDVSEFDIILSDYNKLLLNLGFKRRMDNKMVYTRYKNKGMNRYMGWIIIRLGKAKNARQFGFLAQMAMKHSVAFRVSALNHVFPAGYKKMPLSYIVNIANKVKKIIQTRDDNLVFKRVYIPKDPIEYNKNKDEYKGKYRPLGVPLASGRVVLHMWNNFLTIFLKYEVGKTQHAYQPRKGTLTAGKELVSKINKYDYIYEIDLKNCFGEIQAEAVTQRLMDLGVPPLVYYYLENLNRCTPKFAMEDLVDESALREKASGRNLKEDKTPSLYDAFNEMSEEDQNVVIQIAHEEGFELGEFIQLQGALLDQYKPTSIGNSHKGLPQGSNISPILTIMVLKEFTEQLDSVFYADDGIFFSNSPITIKDNPELGIIINREKSSVVKEEGKGKKNIVFLGLEYNPGENSLSGHTRKGSRLKFTPKAENLHKLLEELKPVKFSQGSSKGERLFKSTLGGWAMSKLYNATWKELEFMALYDPEGVKNSWLDLKKSMDDFRTTSSRACYALANIIDEETVFSKKLAAVKAPKKKGGRAIFKHGRGFRIKV